MSESCTGDGPIERTLWPKEMPAMRGPQRAQGFHRPSGRRTYSPRMFSVCVDARGRRWAAWHATEGALEVIRVFSPEARPEPEAICELGLHFEPTVCANADGGLWCVWSKRVEDRWQLVARLRGNDWGPPLVVPTENDFVFHTTNASMHQDACGQPTPPGTTESRQ